MNVLELSEQEIVRRNNLNELRALGIDLIRLTNTRQMLSRPTSKPNTMMLRKRNAKCASRAVS